MTEIVLYDYPKSSASYRVRIALNLANVDYEKRQVNLLDNDQNAADHLARNPQGFVPVLQIDGQELTQSLAIIDYLDHKYQLDLLPNKPVLRAQTLALSYAIAMDIHPICNLSVMNYATQGQEPARTDWMKQFIGPGLAAFNDMVAPFQPSKFSISDQPTLPDLCLIPQLYNANRWHVDYRECAHILTIEKGCHAHAAFINAAP